MRYTKSQVKKSKLLYRADKPYDECEEGEKLFVPVDFPESCFFEMEFIPYQTPKWRDIPQQILKAHGIQSRNIAQKLVGALIYDTASGLSEDPTKTDPEYLQAKGRIFIVRGSEVWKYFRDSAAAREDIAKLISHQLVFSFSSPRTRSVSGNNLKPVLIDALEKTQTPFRNNLEI